EAVAREVDENRSVRRDDGLEVRATEAARRELASPAQVTRAREPRKDGRTGRVLESLDHDDEIAARSERQLDVEWRVGLRQGSCLRGLRDPVSIHSTPCRGGIEEPARAHGEALRKRKASDDAFEPTRSGNERER